MTRRDCAAAALRGARYLDRNEPGWANDIDLRVLDMGSGSMCVLGQCFGDFYDALHDQLKPRKTEGGNLTWAEQHGFVVPSAYQNNGSYERLAFAWAPLIAVRQVSR